VENDEEYFDYSGRTGYDPNLNILNYRRRTKILDQTVFR
jgi:hypothetical protein